MASSRFDSPRSSRRLVWIGLMLAAAMIAPARLAAQDDKPRIGPISLEELNRDVRLRIRKLAEAALNAQRPVQRGLEDELINRGIEQRGEEAAYQQAKLAREVAEIRVNEYEEGIAVLDRATIMGEIRLAENSAARAKAMVDKIEATLQKLQKFEPTQIYEMTTVYNLQQSLRAAQLQIPKYQIELEQAQGKLKSFEAYQKPKRTKELQVEVEKALADELIKKESLEAFNEDLALMKQRAELAKKRKKPNRAPLFSALDEAVALESTLQTQLKESPPADPKERQSWDERLASQTAKLRAALDKAEQLSDDVDFEQLGERVHVLLQDTEAARTPKSEK
ncbi:hypothetical protein [Paludisphaera borealis]|nr:hypothetical protein [Paludisphaera borealis]